MSAKSSFTFTFKALILVLILAAVVGWGMIFLMAKAVFWGAEKLKFDQAFETKKTDFDLSGMIKNQILKNVQPVRVVDEQSQVIEVVKKASPAVVSIVASAQVPTFEMYFDTPPGLPDDLAPFFSQPMRRQNGTQEQKIGAGTGFLVSSDGYIITNKHVVSSEGVDYTVYLNDSTNRGEKIKAKVVATDPANDLAVLKIDKTNLPFLTFSDSSSLQVGQTVITIGYALGEYDNTVSKGVISGLSRSITAYGGGYSPTERLKNLIQSDAAINPGNSGGPMLDITGNVIGVNVAMASAENIGFAILGNEALAAFNQVKDTGTIQKKAMGFLGVRYMIITPAMKANNNLPYDYGAIIIRGENSGDLAVVPGSPADKAGLVENDIILEVDGERISERNQLADLISKYKPNDEVTLKIYHAGQVKVVTVKLGTN